MFPHPSPIEPLHRLTQHLSSKSNSEQNSNVTIFIKRDDCNSGLGGGGNKVRKLEYVLADAAKQGANTLVTTGGVQSNHMRQTVAAGRRIGMETVLLPQERVSNNTPSYRGLGNVQLTHLMSATHLPADADVDSTLLDLESQGKKPYWIPSGASTHPLGGLGYARCAFEIKQQERELGLGSSGGFDVVVVPTMSGSTLGGLVAGFKAVDRPMRDVKRRLIGVLAGPKDKADFVASILSIARATAALIGVPPERITEADFEIDERWSAGEYGRLDDNTRDGVKLLASMEGVITDPVYSGKALTGLLEMVRRGEVVEGGRVLFLHTGGTLSVSAYEGLR
ncbi:1-aminocyclopropane-1-carboxylate deaminase [Melanomma pulvis-pyrius CBS 109.77]|uniref:1-aminocyclopropane-1-carboxylate deaminase n=1 Tax=Melanomma pulvis-pyrius CBS 109.77 TaxID=1314802 RepID=A0A6A6XNX5_9PLEO|nr:1-aminocyclopropane-1-carboxylate deaminase [Melanomma pulvis-pyrius CBS 109.77]